MTTGTQRRGVPLLVGAQGVSVSGDMVLLTAASIVVFRQTDSATAVSLLLGLAALPAVTLGPIAGTVADWYSRRRILVLADLVSAMACVAAVGIGAAVSTEASAFLSVALVGMCGAFYRPAAQALLPSLSGPEALGRANSALRLATSLANIAGPSVAALLVANGGLQVVLWVDAASFLASAGLVLAIRNIPAREATAARRGAFREAWAGLEYARGSARIRTVTMAIGVVMLVGTLVNAGSLPLVADTLDLPESRYGLLLGIEGAGAMALAVTFLIFGPGRRLLVSGSFALLGVGVTTLLIGSSTTFEVAAAAFFLQGASVVGLQVAFASYLQGEAADAFRGRVMSLVGMVASVAQLSGYAMAGPLVEGLGVRVAFVLAGTAICVVSAPVVSLAFVTAREQREAASA